MEEVYSISQQLLTSHLPNEDYAAILLTHSQDIADLRDKVVEANNGENPDNWLDASAKVTMLEALQNLREEYLTYVGPLCKDNSPAEIADAVNEAYKSQIKANLQLGKDIEHELHSIASNTYTSFMNISKRLDTDAAKISALERTCGDLKKKVGTLDSSLITLKDQHFKMNDLMRVHVTEQKEDQCKDQYSLHSLIW